MIVINISTFINICSYFSVLADPRIDLERGPTFVEENTTVTLPKCHVTGSPTPEVKWSKVGGRLPALSEVEDGQLKIVNATKQDAGQYKCEATNSVGSDDAETSVEVVEFVKPPEVLNTAEGEVVAAKCHVTTEKLHSVEWSKANKVLSLSPRWRHFEADSTRGGCRDICVHRLRWQFEACRWNAAECSG